MKNQFNSDDLKIYIDDLKIYIIALLGWASVITYFGVVGWIVFDALKMWWH